MGITSYICCIGLILFPCVYNAEVKDQITSLPGIDKLPSFKQYSGYLKASSTKRFHYWFAESQNNPATDPVVLWLNGGPGCSSLDGFLSENGPLLVVNASSLKENQYSWNKDANVIYLESPAGVGYSYDMNGVVQTDDDEVATNNYNALVDFFTKFPEYAKNDFYITGESYGGIYIPTLSIKILEAKYLKLKVNQVQSPNPPINLKGMAIGNGLISYNINTNSLIFFGYYHGILGERLWNDLTYFCCKSNNVTRDGCDFAGSKDGQCQDYTEQALQYIYNGGLNIYALYQDCTIDNVFDGGRLKRYQADMKSHLNHMDETKQNKFLQSTKVNRPVSSDDILYGSPPCIDDAAVTGYLNRKDVREALHIEHDLPDWTICSDAVTDSYGRTYQDMFAQYKRLLQEDGFRIFLYYGDTDMACNFLGGEWFVDQLNLELKRARAPWYTNKGQVAGYDMVFDKDFTYTTIRGAGHMVPQFKPTYAYEMFTHFLKNQPLPH